MMTIKFINCTNVCNDVNERKIYKGDKEEGVSQCDENVELTFYQAAATVVLTSDSV